MYKYKELCTAVCWSIYYCNKTRLCIVLSKQFCSLYLLIIGANKVGRNGASSAHVAFQIELNAMCWILLCFTSGGSLVSKSSLKINQVYTRRKGTSLISLILNYIYSAICRTITTICRHDWILLQCTYLGRTAFVLEPTMCLVCTVYKHARVLKSRGTNKTN